MGGGETRKFCGVHIGNPLSCRKWETTGDFKQVSRGDWVCVLIGGWGNRLRRVLPKYRKMGLEAVAVVQVRENELWTQDRGSGDWGGGKHLDRWISVD